MFARIVPADSNSWRNFATVLAFAFLAGLLIMNCGALFLGSSQPISINTNPDGARILINGTPRGTTPVNLKLRTNETYIITFQKEGYKDQSYSLTNHVDAGIVVLDVLFGLLPVVVDAATGAWYRLDENYIDMPLEIMKLE